MQKASFFVVQKGNKMAYEINYNDDRFKQVETDKNEALSELEQTYAGMAEESEKYYQAQIDASKQWAATQQQLQQAKTDFAIEQIEQQKEQSTKEYKREQSGAYVDWQKESNRYGANAEQMAAQGLANTGYSESSQVSMYNTYQNRVATARESYNLVIMNYNNAIKDARLQNNSILAEIAYNSLQQQLELSLQGFQYKNQLLADKANQKAQIENRYDNRYQAVLDQMNRENALQEEIRQYNQNYQLEMNKYNESIRQYNESLAEERRQYDANLSLQQAKLAEEKRQYDATLAAKNSTSTATISITSSSTSSKPKNNQQTNQQRIAADNPEVNTAYYQGDKNPDANKYGTFSNGYQPKGISGHGELEKSGEKVQIDTKTLSGQKQTVVQNVWKADDGTKWYWEGRQNEYLQLK